MAILAFQKPDKVIMLEADDKFGRFEFRPLEPGYGITVGNAIRRILLNSLEGYAITTIKIESVEHEFSSITGVVEDVTEIILNLKKIRFKQLIDDVDHEKITVNITGQDTFKSGDLNRYLSGFEVLNPDVEVCHMETSVELQIELTINKGRGYVPAEENKPLDAEFGLIPIDRKSVV
jgi:DNA-directed RNA polymerase subunit alpha